MQSDKVSRREYLKYIGSFVIGAVIFGGGVAAYYASLPPAKEVITKTVTTTVPGPTVTRTVTVTATSAPTPTPTPTPTPSPTPSPTPKPTPVGPKRELKISHQWAVGDIRHELCERFAKLVEERTGGSLTFKIYPAASLYKPVPQYDAMVEGALDLCVYPLDYASGKVPQFSITLMPCIIRNHDHGNKWMNEEIGREIERIMERSGLKTLTWAWFGGGIGSNPHPIILPKDVKGVKIRAAGKYFDFMLHRLGGAIASMPSSEIYVALQTKVLDACLTSSDSFMSYRLYEQLKYFTSARYYSIWYMFEPLVMGMPTWRSLTPEQQDICLKTGQELHKWIAEELKKSDIKCADFFKEKGVIVHDMTISDWEEWAKVAAETSWKDFAEKVPDGKKLIELALAVKP